ncbi:SDR family oxidoreductase [Chitinophaga sp. 22321]|uniref:SDR family oxidoreductase n=1 Tax=Chitinophaga hostae TaxID=2831022 RepID=A0ABS5IYU5_9BACT|nr:SDR family oxidoreductase [Chitinophaga hostae]MBS0028050.1 SDR family oxidoreductase [Chitinophaga hostae]
MKNLENKIALITGGNSGIGYATAKELIAQGATVIITGRRKEAVDAAAAALGAFPFTADQSSVAAIEQLAADIKEQFGKIDILFINAGIVGSTSIEMATEALFDNVMAVNFKGAYFTLSRFIPLLKDGASVVFLSSNTASMNTANASIYSSSKAGLNAIMKIAALELAPRGIRVNAVSPGPTETEIFNKMGLDETGIQSIKNHVTDKVPLAKMGRAQDVGKMVAYFCGEASGFITGAEIVMDGGMSLAN